MVGVEIVVVDVVVAFTAAVFDMQRCGRSDFEPVNGPIG